MRGEPERTKGDNDLVMLIDVHPVSSQCQDANNTDEAPVNDIWILNGFTV